MPNHSFNLFGKDTYELLPVGYGLREMDSWPLEAHSGPLLWLSLLGGEGRKIVYLPQDLLKLLYERFIAANPSGTSIDINDMAIAKFAPQNLTEKELNELINEGKLFLDIVNSEEDEGYPHLKKYLPELNSPEVIAAMGRDRSIDRDLLSKALANGAVPDTKTMDPRWTAEWKWLTKSRP
ncbi:MAG: hypothetical protein JF606_23420 [Burkholderiales bacterium]|nr:hypothetical protein [Burkholderiales bacterium]